MIERDEGEDRAYYAKRAQDERQFAATCEDNSAALVHLKMADEYDRRANSNVIPLTTVS